MFTYIFGILGALIMGAGMSFIMTDIGTKLSLDNRFVPGITLGIIGLFMCTANYPIFKGILSSRRKKYADKIIAVSDKIMKG